MIPEWIPKAPEPALSPQECGVASVTVEAQNVITDFLLDTIF